jgi:hypothetical protein
MGKWRNTMEIPWKNIENTMEYMVKCMEYMEYY